MCEVKELKRPFSIPDGQLGKIIKSTVNDKVTYMKHNGLKWRREGEPDCGSWDGEVSDFTSSATQAMLQKAFLGLFSKSATS